MLLLSIVKSALSNEAHLMCALSSLPTYWLPIQHSIGVHSKNLFLKQWQGWIC